MAIGVPVGTSTTPPRSLGDGTSGVQGEGPLRLLRSIERSCCNMPESCSIFRDAGRANFELTSFNTACTEKLRFFRSDEDLWPARATTDIETPQELQEFMGRGRRSEYLPEESGPLPTRKLSNSSFGI